MGQFRKCVPLSILLLLAGCSTHVPSTSPTPRTSAEKQAITNAWYPVKSADCQSIVNVFQAITADIGDPSTEHLATNMASVQAKLKMDWKIAGAIFRALAEYTREKSIRDWALEAAPIFEEQGRLMNSNNADAQDKAMQDFATISGTIPEACRN